MDTLLAPSRMSPGCGERDGFGRGEWLLGPGEVGWRGVDGVLFAGLGARACRPPPSLPGDFGMTGKECRIGDICPSEAAAVPPVGVVTRVSFGTNAVPTMVWKSASKADKAPVDDATFSS